ncbi:MAG: enoyl-CoA hydratase/isomerase family protein [Betaproteobacteria bacterium]|nr:enoyl-CoA hydratase/isomerase family protein [Betaproteobacteria bacterium]
MPAESELLVANSGATRRLVLNRPAKRNALNDALLHRLVAELETARAEESVRTIVLGGAGHGFCSGRDRRDVGGADSPRVQMQDGSLEATVSLFTRVLTLLLESPIPTIASVRGFALAGGQALTLACDFLVAERGSRFGNPEMQHGFPAAMNTVLLARHIGRRKALEIALTGAAYTVEEYSLLGLINRVAEPGTLEDVTAGFAAQLNKLAPWSVRRTKQLLRVAEDGDLRGLMHAGDQLNQLLRLNAQSAPLFADQAP